MNTDTFDMVAKTFQGLEEVLADELRALGAEDVTPGRRMVAFRGDKALMYKANLHCRTALRILKPFYTFQARTPERLYDRVKEFDWSTMLTPDKTFAIEVTVNSDSFTNSRFVTYKVKDAIADWFRDHDAEGRRPGVRLTDADVVINVHISGTDCTLSLDSSGESLHRRGWREAQTEAPINEVLAAGIILKSGWKGDSPLVDPMCGSGTFLVEAALIAANIAPGLFRKGFAFEQWPDFDAELFESLYNDDSAEREITVPIVGADINRGAIEVARRNLKRAGVAKYVDLQVKPLEAWTEAPAPDGVLITNPPYGERLKPADIDGLYEQLGQKLKHVFTGYRAWVIGYRDETLAHIGLKPSSRETLLNGSLECELREYVIFSGDKRSFRAGGGKLQSARTDTARLRRKPRPADKPAADAPADAERPARAAEPENPLAKRRNVKLLEAILAKHSGEPDAAAPKPQPRKGWKRKEK